MGKIWSKEIIIARIQSLNKSGSPINPNFVQINHRPLYLAAIQKIYFGNRKTAVEAAGFDYESVRIKIRARPKWSKEKVVLEILSMRDRNIPLHSNYAQVNFQNLYRQACKYCGSWEKAIIKAGLNYEQIRKKPPNRKWNKTAVIAAIKQRKRKGLPISGALVSVQDRGLYNAGRKLFKKNGWKEALQKAGVDPKDVLPTRIWTKKRVLSEIRRLHRARVPVYAYYLQQNEHSKLVAGGVKRFDSWRKAIKAAGLSWGKIRGTKKPRKWWTRNRVIRRIKQLNAKGIQLSSKFIHHKYGDLFAAAVVYCNSWGEAVYAAGINYREHCKVWSSKAWLKQFKKNTVEVENLQLQTTVMVERRKTHANKSHHNRCKS